MNLLERDNKKQEEREAQKRKAEKKEEGDFEELKEFGDPQDAYEQEEDDGKDNRRAGFSRKEQDKNPLIVVLFGIIIVLLIIIFVIVLLMPARRTASTETLQQDITDYANEQKQNDKRVDIPVQEAITVEPQKPEEPVDVMEQTEEEALQTTVIEPETVDKTAIVVDIEDENDISYTKEFILNEMMPYFADNNVEAIWDLAHLRRYVKLSAQLIGSGTYYYMGDVNASGAPDGIGLAIYENNSYYYGSWSDGKRSGDGRWYRFYIDEIGKPLTKKKYQAHSYSGQWSNDLPNGEGAEHYDIDITQIAYEERVIQNVIGHFTDGLYDGEMYANSVDEFGNVEEWNAVAHNGVFDLWRDMSRIGECSVWQHRDNPDLCLDIDKSENKNQGIRELLRITTK